MNRKYAIFNLVVFIIALFVIIMTVYAQNYGKDFTRIPFLLDKVADAAIYSLEGRKQELGSGKTWLSTMPAGYSVLLKDGSRMTKEDWIAEADAAIVYIDSLITAINDER